MELSINWSLRGAQRRSNLRIKDCFASLAMTLIRIGVILIMFIFCSSAFAEDIKEPNVAGQFYPGDKKSLSAQIDQCLDQAEPEAVKGDILCLISPHAGYDFSGPTAAFGYKLIQGKTYGYGYSVAHHRPLAYGCGYRKPHHRPLAYKTVVVIGPSHYYGFNGIAVYPAGKFRTPLGDLEIDSDFAQKLLNPKQNISSYTQAFDKEHSIEVQLPFLQKTITDFKIVPIVIGQCEYAALNQLAENLSKAIGSRTDVLITASTDLTHSYDFTETRKVDKLTLKHLQEMDPEDIYRKLSSREIQMCGGLPVVSAIITAKKLGYDKIKLLSHTDSAEVTGNRTKGNWTVGYASAVIYKENYPQEEKGPLNPGQKKRLLEIARETIEEHLKSGKRPDLSENDPQLTAISGAFVTLRKQGELRGCIGNIIGQKPLYETVRDMAIESATADPRFQPVTKEEFKDIEIEISVLSPLKKILDISEFELGKHGVIVKKGWLQGVFLPQVAIETGWSKEEFLSNLCAHKAGLSPDAWKDPETEIYIFSAIVFSEKQEAGT